MIPFDGLHNKMSGFGQKFQFSIFGILSIVSFHLVFVVASKVKLIPPLRFIAVTLKGLEFDMLVSPVVPQNWLDFGRLLIFRIMLAS